MATDVGMAVDTKLVRPKFTVDDADRAYNEWGCNCGPAAAAAICGLTLDEIRPMLGDFEKKKYTNPTLMWEVLRNTRRQWTAGMIGSGARGLGGRPPFPFYGLVRVQWEGPWTKPGVPMRVRYRHTHWVGATNFGGDWTVPGWQEPYVFDVNCMCVGGWVSLSEWSTSVVPWLLGQCEPKADGKWHLTHVVEVERP